MKELIINCINSGDYHKIEEKINAMEIEEIRDILMDIVYESESIAVYTFLQCLISKKETADLHYLSSEILCMPLSHIIGAYNSALFHARRAVDISPQDVSLKEYLLFFNSIPDKLVNDDEARELAIEILEKNPASEVAKKILEK